APAAHVCDRGLHDGVAGIGRVVAADGPADLGDAAVALADGLGIAVAQQVRRGDDSVALDRHERVPVDHPRVDAALLGLALQLGHDGVDGQRHAGQQGGDVDVDETRELVAVAALERTYLHGRISRGHTHVDWRPATGAVRAERTTYGSFRSRIVSPRLSTQ